MYTDYWGLKKPPFDNVPDPTMYVEAHSSVENTVAETLFAIEEGNECLTVIVGTVGLGKTLSLRMILDLLDHEKYKIAFVTNPDMSFVQLLREIIGQLTGKECDVKGRIELLEVFNKLLFSTADEGKKVLIFIDEANAISPANLESLRLLTNMQDDDRNLFTIVLAGQMEFAKRLEHPKRANLFQRIGTYNRIERMEREELVKNYVETRLKLAGTTKRVFTDDAIHALWEYSEHGVPRLVNKIAKLCLKAGETNNFEIITGEIVQQIGDRFDKMTGPSIQKRRVAKAPSLKVPGKEVIEGSSENERPQESVFVKRGKVSVYEPPPPPVPKYEAVTEARKVESPPFVPEPVIPPQKVEPPLPPVPEIVIAPQKTEPPPVPKYEAVTEVQKVESPPFVPEPAIPPQKVEPPPPPVPEIVIAPQKTESPPVPKYEAITEAQKVESPPFVPEPVIPPQKVEPPPPPVPKYEAVTEAQKVEPQPSLDWTTLKKIAEEIKRPFPESFIAPQKTELPPPTPEAVREPIVTARKSEQLSSPRPDTPLDWSTLKKLEDELREPVVDTIEPLLIRGTTPTEPVRGISAETKTVVRPPIEKSPEAGKDNDTVSVAGFRVRIEIPTNIMEQTQFASSEQRRKTAGVLAAQTLEKNPELTASPTVDPVSIWSEILGIIMKRIER